MSEYFFETVAKARLCCRRADCSDCCLKEELGISCGDISISDEVDKWLEELLRRLEMLQKQYQEVTDDEFLWLISGGNK